MTLSAVESDPSPYLFDLQRCQRLNITFDLPFLLVPCQPNHNGMPSIKIKHQDLRLPVADELEPGFLANGGAISSRQLLAVQFDAAFSHMHPGMTVRPISCVRVSLGGVVFTVHHARARRHGSVRNSWRTRTCDSYSANCDRRGPFRLLFELSSCCLNIVWFVI
jgi:hypothetical protein